MGLVPVLRSYAPCLKINMSVPVRELLVVSHNRARTVILKHSRRLWYEFLMTGINDGGKVLHKTCEIAASLGEPALSLFYWQDERIEFLTVYVCVCVCSCVSLCFWAFVLECARACACVWFVWRL